MAYLTETPIDITRLLASVQAPHLGAVSSFIGLVRDHHQGRRVTGLEYTAYGAMVEDVCAEIVADASARWECRVALAHRIGTLAVGEVAVAVGVGAAHRGAAFDGCRWVIEQVKHRVPIWKRERYDDGTEAWVDPTASTTTGATSR